MGRASDQRSEGSLPGLETERLQALISEARNGRLMALGSNATMAATNKYLARSNKSLERIKATKKKNRQ